MSDDPGTSTPTSTATPPAAAEWGAQQPPAAPPARRGVRSPRSLIWIGVAAVLVVGGVTGFVTTRGGSSTDGTFSTGDCVTLTTSTVHIADCGGQHDGQITAVLHQSYQTCPSGSDEFDVTDNTGNLCVDRSK